MVNSTFLRSKGNNWLKSACQYDTYGFLLQQLRQNNTAMMTFCIQLVNVGCWLQQVPWWEGVPQMLKGVEWERKGVSEKCQLLGHSLSPQKTPRSFSHPKFSAAHKMTLQRYYFARVPATKNPYVYDYATSQYKQILSGVKCWTKTHFKVVTWDKNPWRDLWHPIACVFIQQLNILPLFIYFFTTCASSNHEKCLLEIPKYSWPKLYFKQV